MIIITHHIQHKKIAEIGDNQVILRNEDDGIQLVGEIYYAGYDALIIYEHQLTPDFFELKNGLAGAILQKFTNYKIQLAIIGNFSAIQSNSLRDFISESNKRKHINFVESLSDTLELFTN
jgi:hypothetical protein